MANIFKFFSRNISIFEFSPVRWAHPGIHAPPGPRTARCELVRDFSGFFGPGAVRSDFSKKFSVRCGPIFLNFHGAGAVRSYFFQFRDSSAVRSEPGVVRP